MPLALLRNVDLALAMEQLAERAMNVPIGTLLDYAELTELTKQPRTAIYKIVAQVNNDLLQAKRLLVNVQKQGYQVATPDEHLQHVESRRLRGRRQFLKAKQEAIGLDISSFTNEQRRDYGQVLTQLDTLAHFAIKSARKGLAAAQESMKAQQRAVADMGAIQSHIEHLRKQVDQS